jgi:hypothetical protein
MTQYVRQTASRADENQAWNADKIFGRNFFRPIKFTLLAPLLG